MMTDRLFTSRYSQKNGQLSRPDPRLAQQIHGIIG